MNWEEIVQIAIDEMNNKKERVAYVKPLYGVINIFDIAHILKQLLERK